MRIEVWHGKTQKVGHLGRAQPDFNVLGRIVAADGKVSLSYQVNDGPPEPLSVGSGPHGDARRLAAPGHFNADINLEALLPGTNRIRLIARNGQGAAAEEIVTVQRLEGASPLPVSIDWSQIEDPQDVGQYVDGEWRLDGEGLRTCHTGYDRIFLIGCETWQDYEVLTSMTLHGLEDPTGPKSGPPGLGLIMRFTGFVIGGHRDFPAAQPKWGYQPIGAIQWARWTEGPTHAPHRQLYSGGKDWMLDGGVLPWAVGQKCWIRARCTTRPDQGKQGVTRYEVRFWLDGQGEPATWDWQINQKSEHSLRRGGVALIAHHVDATFGNVQIR